MARSKRLLILVAVLLAVCAAAFAALNWQQRQEQIAVSGEAVLTIAADSVQSLSWTYGETALAFTRGEDGGWTYDADAAFPVDPAAMEELLAPFDPFSAAFVIEEAEEEGQYGLDNPACSITIATEEETWEIRLGGTSAVDGQRYVSFGEGTVYLAASDPLDAYGATLSDLIDQDESLSYDTVSAIRFAGAADYAVSYAEGSADAWFGDDVYFTEDGGETVPLDTERVGDYLESLTTLRLIDYVTYNVTEEELEQYGLDDPELTVEVDYTRTDEDGAEISGTYVLAVSRDAEELAAAQAAEEAGQEPEDVTGYVRVGDSQIVYRVSATTCEALLAGRYDDLRHRAVLRADLDAVTALDITLEGSAYTLAADGSEDEAGSRIWTYGETEVDFTGLQSALEGLKAGSAEDFSFDGAPGQEEIRLTAHLDSETRPETEIVLYRYDGTRCVAEVDGEAVCLVSREGVVDLMEAVYAIVLADYTEADA